MTAPVTITTRRQPPVLATYAFLALAGVLLGPLPFHSPSVLTHAYGWVEDVLAYTLILGAIAVAYSQWASNLGRALAAQAGGSFATSAALTTYALSVYSNGPTGIVTGTIVLGMAIGAGLRMRESLRDLRKLDDAANAPVKPVPLKVERK